MGQTIIHHPGTMPTGESRSGDSPRVRSIWAIVATVAYLAAGAVEIALAFRVMLLMFGADLSVPVVAWIPVATAPLVSPFAGLLAPTRIAGASVIDWTTLAAGLAYALAAWAIGAASDVIAVGSARIGVRKALDDDVRT